MIRALLILLFGTFIFAATLTPLIFAGLIAINPELPWPFSRVFSRVATISAFLIIYFYRKEFDLKQLKKYFAPSASNWIRNSCNVLIGSVIAMSVTFAFFDLVLAEGKVAWGVRTNSEILWKAIYIMPVALLIASIEEAFFRVILLEKFKTYLAPLFAATLVSIIYAIIHFISPVKGFNTNGFSFTAGFHYLSLVVERMFLPEVYPAMFGLFLVGLVLALAVTLTRTIYLSLGLHAGWILAVKLVSFATSLTPGSSFSVGTSQRYYLVSTLAGWYGIILAGVLVALIGRALRPRSKVPPTFIEN